MSKNYFDENGNYVNVDNLTLAEIFKHGFLVAVKNKKILGGEFVQGEWVDNHNGTYTCIVCGFHHSKSNFCPNCGADMRPKEGEEK